MICYSYLSTFSSSQRYQVGMLVTHLSYVRHIVREHDPKLNSKKVKSNRRLLFSKEVGYTNFQSTDLIGLHLKAGHDDSSGDLRLYSSSISQPFTTPMIADFMRLNRHLFIQKRKGSISFNTEYEGKSPEKLPPHYIEEICSWIKDDIVFYDFDDLYWQEELVFAIIVNK